MPSREYELTAVYDLAVAETGGPDASVLALTTHVEARGGKVIRVDHWGRRRLAYPIGTALDADFIVSRIEIEPGAVSPLEAALRIDEKVYRHLVVRADELPPPPVPREPRQAPAVAATVVDAPTGEAAATEPAPAAEEAAAPTPEAPVTDAAAPDAAEPVVEAVAPDAAEPVVAASTDAEETPAEAGVEAAADAPASDTIAAQEPAE